MGQVINGPQGIAGKDGVDGKNGKDYIPSDTEVTLAADNTTPYTKDELVAAAKLINVSTLVSKSKKSVESEDKVVKDNTGQATTTRLECIDGDGCFVSNTDKKPYLIRSNTTNTRLRLEFDAKQSISAVDGTSNTELNIWDDKDENMILSSTDGSRINLNSCGSGGSIDIFPSLGVEGTGVSLRVGKMLNASVVMAKEFVFYLEDGSGEAFSVKITDRDGKDTEATHLTFTPLKHGSEKDRNDRRKHIPIKDLETNNGKWIDWVRS